MASKTSWSTTSEAEATTGRSNSWAFFEGISASSVHCSENTTYCLPRGLIAMGVCSLTVTTRPCGGSARTVTSSTAGLSANSLVTVWSVTCGSGVSVKLAVRSSDYDTATKSNPSCEMSSMAKIGVKYKSAQPPVSTTTTEIVMIQPIFRRLAFQCSGLGGSSSTV